MPQVNSFGFKVSLLSSELFRLTLLVCGVTIWGATYMIANTPFYGRTKHIEVDFHFVHKQVAHQQLDVYFISSVDQVVDEFTKFLPPPSLIFFITI
jgi:hypothetical protein